MLYAGALQWPVLIDGPTDVQIQIYKTAHFKCFFRVLAKYTHCKWKKDKKLLTASEKYQFSTMVPNDDDGRTNSDSVLCLLYVFNVSMDDVGEYSCLAYYYNRTLGVPREQVWSNLGRAELMLKGTLFCHTVFRIIYVVLFR